MAVGIKILRDRANKTIHMYQPRAIMKTLQETGMSDSNPSPIYIPGTPGFLYTKNDSPNPPTPKTQEAELYRSTGVIGKARQFFGSSEFHLSLSG